MAKLYSKIIYLAVLVMALAAVGKHSGMVEAKLGLRAGALDVIPDPKLLAFLGIFLVLFSVGMTELTVRFFRTKPDKAYKRREFFKESLPEISRHLAEHSHAVQPDIPYIVDYTIYQAIAAGASDIHFDPSEKGFDVRLRIDGLMHDVTLVPAELTKLIVNRLKVISNLVIYQGYLPQDGRLAKDQDVSNGARGNKSADFRVAFMPTLHGERIVIRILGRSQEGTSFDDLGMGEEHQKIVERLIDQPQGMVVLTGPTGSGKTTTIYSALQAILAKDQGKRSIATLENPIEFDIPGINQSQVDDGRGFTFGKGLRAILRQDPDVIMVGEIRDEETAQIAIQAGMTGHLIITTVHANSSAATFSRLMEMNIASFSLNSAVTAVISQRLLRKNCPACSVKRPASPEDLEQMGLGQNPEAALHVYEGTGCDNCGMSGFKGRVAAFEIMEVSEQIRDLITNHAAADEIYTTARSQGMHSLHEGAIAAVQRGLTTPGEVHRAVVMNIG